MEDFMGVAVELCRIDLDVIETRERNDCVELWG